MNREKKIYINCVESRWEPALLPALERVTYGSYVGAKTSAVGFWQSLCVEGRHPWMAIRESFRASSGSHQSNLGRIRLLHFGSERMPTSYPTPESPVKPI